MGLASKLASKLANKASPKRSRLKPNTEKTFKEKFKDTTVVDQNKNPAIMYHGRVQDYDRFETVNTGHRGEIGTHFGPANQANIFAKGEGGNVVPVYLNIKNPLRLQDRGTFNVDEVLEQLRFEGFDNAAIDKIENLPVKEQNKATIDLIKSKGYDGIVYLNRTDGFNFKGTQKQIERKKELLEAESDPVVREKFGAKDSYIIFDATQAKSPFNKGDYSETDPRFNFNKGGSTLSGDNMKAKKQTAKLLEEGGMLDEGGTTDPESGNEVPAGSLQEEVRDDIPAQLSEGEFVFPADVVRFIGLERLMQMRQAAKRGLAQMDKMGQMGNSEEATMDDDEDTEFETEIDDILSEVESEAANGKMPEAMA